MKSFQVSKFFITFLSDLNRLLLCLLTGQEAHYWLQATISWDVTKHGVNLLFHLLGSFSFSTTSLLMSEGAIPTTTNKYKSSTYAGWRYHVIAQHALFSSGSSTPVCLRWKISPILEQHIL